MRYILTERQYKILEQTVPGTALTISSQDAQDFFKSHTFNMVLSIASAFVPVVGPFLSAGIQLADAGTYLKEGDKKMAGLVALFAVIPALGPIASKIGVSKWTAKQLGEIGKKIGQGTKLTPQEIEIAKRITTNQSQILSAAKSLGTKTAKVGGQIAGYAAGTVAYGKTYDWLAGCSAFNPDFINSSFGNSGSETDRQKLIAACGSGWRPGKPVPPQYQTQVYKEGEKLVAL